MELPQTDNVHLTKAITDIFNGKGLNNFPQRNLKKKFLALNNQPLSKSIDNKLNLKEL